MYKPSTYPYLWAPNCSSEHPVRVLPPDRGAEAARLLRKRNWLFVVAAITAVTSIAVLVLVWSSMRRTTLTSDAVLTILCVVVSAAVVQILVSAGSAHHDAQNDAVRAGHLRVAAADPRWKDKDWLNTHRPGRFERFVDAARAQGRPDAIAEAHRHLWNSARLTAAAMGPSSDDPVVSLGLTLANAELALCLDIIEDVERKVIWGTLSDLGYGGMSDPSLGQPTDASPASGTREGSL